MARPQTTHAALYNASGELGQFDDHDNPVYTKNAADNLSQPNGLGFNFNYGDALDMVHHRLFVVDNGNNRVLVFQLDSNNNPSSAIASYVLGQPDFTSSGTAATQNGLSSPQGVAYDSVNDRLLVADANNVRVLVFDTSSIHNGMNASYVIGQANFTSNIATTTQNGLNGPEGVAYDITNNRLFVGDYSNSRVMIFDVSPSVIANGKNASYVLGQQNFTSTATTTQSGLHGLEGLAYDNTNARLFVNDFQNKRILVFDVATSTITNGENASNVLGQANFTSSTMATTQNGFGGGDNNFAYDGATGRLFVTDSINNRVLVYNASPGTITNGMNASYVLGQAIFTSSTATTTKSGLKYPAGLTYDSINQHLFISDGSNNRIVIFDVNPATIANGKNAINEMGEYDDHDNPVYTKNAADNVSHPNGRGFNNPYGIALDTKNHRLFVGDTTNHRVMVYTLNSSNNPSSAVASYVLGQPNFNSNIATTTQSGLDYNGLMAYDSIHERLFTVDGGTNHNNRIMVFNVDPATIANGENASYVLGQSDFSSKVATTTQSHFGTTVQGAAYDPVTDRLFAAEGAYRILVFDVRPSIIANGMNASYILGQANFTSAVASTTRSGLSTSIESITYDLPNQRLFVSDSDNNRIMVFNVATSTITNGENADYALGQPNFTSSTATTTQSGVGYVEGVIYDSATQRLFAADGAFGTGRVLIFDVNPSTVHNGENAANVLGASDFTTTIATTTQSGFNYVEEMDYDPTNHRLFTALRKNLTGPAILAGLVFGGKRYRRRRGWGNVGIPRPLRDFQARWERWKSRGWTFPRFPRRVISTAKLWILGHFG